MLSLTTLPPPTCFYTDWIPGQWVSELHRVKFMNGILRKVTPVHIYIGVIIHTWYLSFFSMGTSFGSFFLHAKARKSRQNRFCGKKQRKLQTTDFATKQWKCDIQCAKNHTHDISDFPICHVEKSEFSPHGRCREISDFSTWQIWRNLSFLHMTNVEIFQISPHLWCGEILIVSTWWLGKNVRFLHMTNV